MCTDAVLVEVHFGHHAPGGVDPAQRMLRALNRTHVLYYAEPNPGAAGCIEFAPLDSKKDAAKLVRANPI